jgi:hypothetical protein
MQRKERLGERKCIFYFLSVDDGFEIIDPGSNAGQGRHEKDVYLPEKSKNLATQYLALSLRTDVFAQIGSR